MNNKSTSQTVLALVLIATATAAVAGRSSTNRLTLSTRYGFNIKAGFSHALAPVRTGAPRYTPDGGLYNYDDGYVLADFSGNAGGHTTYWGFDDSTVQDTGTAILMNRTTVSAASGEEELDGAVPMVGIDLAYSRELLREDDLHFGFDFSFGFMPLLFEERGQMAVTATTVTDAYSTQDIPFVPVATPGAPYQGTFMGPGAGLVSDPVSSMATRSPVGAVNTHSSLEGTLWTARIGPYLGIPLSETLEWNSSLGLSLGWLDVDVDWSTSGMLPTRGSGSDSEVLSGGFIGTELLWRVNGDWRAALGAEFEYLNDWKGEFGGNTATLDLTRSLYITLGLQREF